jgi:hypothetical protein
MSGVENLRRGLVTAASEGVPSVEIEQRVRLLEGEIRRDERERALGEVRHTLATLRSLTAFLQQELEHCIEPLAKICDELEREAASSSGQGA